MGVDGRTEQMDGFGATHKGAGGLAELDLATGAVRRIILTPTDGAPHLLGDFVQLADGTILATETTSPIIWMLARGGSALAPLVTGGFKSLRGSPSPRTAAVSSSRITASACSTSTSPRRRSDR